MKFLSKKHRRMLYMSMQHHRPAFSFSSISRVFHRKAFIAACLLCLFLLMDICALLQGSYVLGLLSVPVIIAAACMMPVRKKQPPPPDTSAPDSAAPDAATGATTDGGRGPSR